MWKLLGERPDRLDERVGDIIPEFATNGKEVGDGRAGTHPHRRVPVRPARLPEDAGSLERLEAFSRWRLDWEPGSRLQFHLTGGGLGHRRAGRASYRHCPSPTTCGPRSSSRWASGSMLPVPEDRFDEVLAVPVAIDRTSDDQEVDPWGPWYLANAKVLAGGEPSHSLVGTAADVALFFQALHHSDVWAPGIVDEATRIYRVRGRPSAKSCTAAATRSLNLGLFCTVSGEIGGQWSPRTGSPRTFGNGGAPCQLAFMDPETDTSFAFLTNGYPMSGYDYSRTGENRIKNIGNLGNDLVG